jgi:predicted Zn finger-like uncharacterized protein
MFEYQCPECHNRVVLEKEAAPGRQVRCPTCKGLFAPRAETIAMTDEPKKKGAKAARPAAKAAKPAGPVAAPARPHVVDDDEFGAPVPYGVVKESEEEKRLYEQNKPTFTETRDKFKKSARGPASALLVLPTNLLVAEGAMTAIVGVMAVIVGMWPLIFTDAPPSDEEYAEQLVIIFAGFVGLMWGSFVCLGASKMQNLESYSWAIVGSVMGIFPLLAGIFAIVTLRDPRVIAGFEEMEGAVDDEPDELEEKDEVEDEDDDDE